VPVARGPSLYSPNILRRHARLAADVVMFQNLLSPIASAYRPTGPSPLRASPQLAGFHLYALSLRGRLSHACCVGTSSSRRPASPRAPRS